MSAPAPMAPEALWALASHALHSVDLALADADGNQERPPYNVETPGGTVLSELLEVAEALAWVRAALSPPSSPAPPPG